MCACVPPATNTSGVLLVLVHSYSPLSHTLVPLPRRIRSSRTNMNSSQLIKASLVKTHIEKVIIFLGYAGEPTHTSHSAPASGRGAVATRVAAALLHRCRPSPSDVHDPDRTRAHARDAKGAARLCYQAYAELQASQGKRGRQRRAEAATVKMRGVQTWDSERVSDFMGLWCDRLLLGDHQRPVRCAVLEPRVPLELEGEAVLRVAQSHHRRLARPDVLVVSSCPDLPFGLVRQAYVDPDAAGKPSGSGIATLPQALQHFPCGQPTRADALSSTAPLPLPSACTSSLLIGVGDASGPRALFSAEEERRLRQCLVPLATFGCALWAANSARSGAYLAEQTPLPNSLTAQRANARLWSSMQDAMLSTRDAALLRAHFSDELLDARLSPQQQTYLADTLLYRLQERDQGQRLP